MPADSLLTLLPVMTTFPHHCFLGENKVSLTIDAASEQSQVLASVVYALNLPCVFDNLGFQRSFVIIEIPQTVFMSPK